MANHFKILPIPSEVIVYVNALSVKDDIKYDKRESIFTFHDKVVDDNIDKDETTPILLQPQLHQDPVGAAARALAADRIGIIDQPQIEDQNSLPGQLDLRGELEDDHAEAGQPTEGGVGGDIETQDNYEIAVELDDIASPAPPSEEPAIRGHVDPIETRENHVPTPRRSTRSTAGVPAVGLTCTCEAKEAYHSSCWPERCPRQGASGHSEGVAQPIE
jgi:hypothetical protein